MMEAFGDCYNIKMKVIDPLQDEDESFSNITDPEGRIIYDMRNESGIYQL